MTHTFDASASAAAFPLGGIGTGNVSLGVRGDLRDWEIFNRPAKGKTLPNTFFALRVQRDGDAPIARVLEGPIPPPYPLSHGYHPVAAAGLPRFKTATMRGEYPFATIALEDDSLPVRVELEVFTPLIPLNPDDSGIPCAVLTYTVTNTSDRRVALTLVGSLTNPAARPASDIYENLLSVERGRAANSFRDQGKWRGLFMDNDRLLPTDLDFGSASLVTNHAHVTVKSSWPRGAWWDFLQVFWDDLMDDGRLDEPDGEQELVPTGSLGLLDSLEPGERKAFRFVISWYFPNRLNTWDERVMSNLGVDPATVGITRNYYATRFADAWDVARYVIEQMPRLEGDTRRFHDALFDSTLPPVILDAISANIVPVRSTTCFWLEDGRFYGWEGCFDEAGCCHGSCTHVWSYAYTAAYLFPTLERSMRRIEFNVETDSNGYMPFRSSKTFHPDNLLVVGMGAGEPAVDGQMGSILRAYREWQLGGDLDFLASIWPGIKRALGFVSGYWDKDNDGVLEGKQHNTYDIEFYGANPLCSIYYLAALLAVAEMAEALREPQLAARCRDYFERGSQRLDGLLWNGEYYVQRLDDVNAYKYQHGEGILSDQLLGQLHATALGLGDLLPPDHLKAAVKAIYDRNFKENFQDHVNCQRTYVLNDEAGLLLCTWPHGGRPRFPFPYSDEVWTGIEYQVAAHLIYEGWLDAGLRIVQAVHDRHDGVRRNPWNEVECGNHYARSMSSWALLLALNGMQCHLSRGELSFAPVPELLAEHRPFKSFWSTGRAWGTYSQTWDEASGTWKPSLEVLGGSIEGVIVTACDQRLT